MLKLGINSIVSPGESSELLDKPVRVLSLRGEELVVIELSTTPAKPWILEKALLDSEIESGAAFINVELPLKFLLRTDAEISDREKASRDKNWNLIRDMVEGQSILDILTSNFGAEVAKHAKIKGVDRKLIYRLLFRYWSMGQVKNAFLWNTVACGGRGKEKSRKSGIIPGRPLKYRGVVQEEGGAILLEKRHFAAINLAYGRFASGKCGTLGDCHSWMLSKFFSAVHTDGSRGDVVRGSYPSKNQLKTNGRKFHNALYALKNRRGLIRYNKDFRPLVGAASQGLIGPCHRYEIDSTIADVYLVHRVNRNWLIGRPVLYAVVDTYTRMIVGIHVGLEGPSWNGARHAIYNAYTPKKEFCKRYNIDIEESDWPCSHLPIELVADRAELLSEAGETMTQTLGTIVKILPPFRPDWKSIIESRFRLINETLDLKFVPGGVDARRLERGDRDYELDAILDIDEFTEMLIAGVLAHNKSLQLPHLLTREMIADDLVPTPINIWNWSFSHNVINTKIVSPSELKIALLPSKECRIARGGINFQGVLYTCQTAVRENWLAHSHNFKTQYVRIFYDPNSIENCWLKTDAGFESLAIVPQHAKNYGGLRMEEVMDIINVIKQVSPDTRYENDNIAAQLKVTQEKIVTGARAKRSGQRAPASKAEFKRNKKIKRATEAQVERDNHTADLNQLRNGDLPVAPILDAHTSQVYAVGGKAGSVRSAAFLKLVVNQAKDPSQ